MKRLMTIALVLLAGLTAGAQGRWTYSNYQADELKGQQAYTAYQYEVPGVGSYVSWGWKDPDFRLITARGIFEETVCYEWYGSFRLGAFEGITIEMAGDKEFSARPTQDAAVQHGNGVWAPAIRYQRLVWRCALYSPACGD